jgi:hypothetical protein
MTITKAQARLIADTLSRLDGLTISDEQFLSVSLVDLDLGTVGYFSEEEGTWLYRPMGA